MGTASPQLPQNWLFSGNGCPHLLQSIKPPHVPEHHWSAVAMDHNVRPMGLFVNCVFSARTVLGIPSMNYIEER
jgi:hypothetical protein